MSYDVAIAAVIMKDKKCLVIKRSPEKKRFPNLWTIPGGKLEPADYENLPRTTEHYWYRILERTLEREVKEEVNLTIKNVTYLTSMVSNHEGNHLVISCLADYADGIITLDQREAVDFKWIDMEEASGIDLIDGIYEEIILAFQSKL